MVRKAGWCRPADSVGFYPPRGELTGQIGVEGGGEEDRDGPQGS